MDHGHEPSVLYAEDEILIAETLADILGDLGFQVHRTADGLEALEASSVQDFDILLTDIDMPRMNGVELIRSLRQNVPGIPVVIITGRPPDGGLRGLGDLGPGPTLMLAKPVRVDDICSALRKAIAQAKPAAMPDMDPSAMNMAGSGMVAA